LTEEYPDPESFQELITISKGAGILFIGTAAGTALKYLFELAIARKLGADSFGLFLIGFSFFKIAEILSTLGLHNGILRYGSIFKAKGDFSRLKGSVLSAMRLVALSAVVFGGIVILFSKLISQSLFHTPKLEPVFAIFSLSLPFSALSMVIVYAIQSFKIVKHRVYVKEIYEPLSRLLFFIILTLTSLRLFGALIAFLVSSMSGAILAIYYLKQVSPQVFDKNILSIYETKILLNFSWPLFFTGFLNILFLWIGTLIAGLYLPQNEIAYYGAAQRTAMLGMIILISFSSIFAPIIADLYYRKEWTKLEHLFKSVAKWIFAISLPVFLSMILFSKDFLHIYGKEFVAGASCLVILSIGQMLSSTCGPFTHMIMMSGRSKINLLNSVLVSLINIILCFLLIPKIGIIGAALAATISLAIVNTVGLIETFMIYKIHPFRPDFIKPLLSGGAASLVSFLILGLLSDRIHFLLALLIGITSFLIVYIPFLFILGINREEKFILEKIKAKCFLVAKKYV
jgi:O-antigen/teichoic acid export membrane protein